MERGGFHGYRKNIISNNTTTTTTTSEVNNSSHSGGGGGGGGSSQDGAETECTVREQDRFMPIANVIRIMRKILPPHAKISDDAKETIQECVSEYISFITGEANERCQREQRKTITAEDVLWAMSKLGFDDYVEPLTLFLHRYREAEGDRSSSSSSSSTTNSSSASVSAAVLGPSFYMRGLPAPPPPSFAAYYASMMSISNSNAGSNGFYGGGGGSDGLGGSHAHNGHGPV